MCTSLAAFWNGSTSSSIHWPERRAFSFSWLQKRWIRFQSVFCRCARKLVPIPVGSLSKRHALRWKVAFETHSEIKENLARCHALLTQSIPRGLLSPEKQEIQKLALLLPYLHTCVQARCSLGMWRGDYIFSLTDLRLAFTLLCMFVGKRKGRCRMEWSRNLVLAAIYEAVIDVPGDQQVSRERTCLLWIPSHVHRFSTLMANALWMTVSWRSASSS